MCAYFAKAEYETSKAIKQAEGEAFISGKSDFTKKESYCKGQYFKTRMFIQDAAYLVMPELWSSTVFLRVIFLNSNMSEKKIYDIQR